MIAPVTERPPVMRQHPVPAENENGVGQQLSRLIENHPVPAVAVAVLCGAVLGWLIKRKEW